MRSILFIIISSFVFLSCGKKKDNLTVSTDNEILSESPPAGTGSELDQNNGNASGICEFEEESVTVESGNFANYKLKVKVENSNTSVFVI